MNRLPQRAWVLHASFRSHYKKVLDILITRQFFDGGRISYHSLAPYPLKKKESSKSNLVVQTGLQKIQTHAFRAEAEVRVKQTLNDSVPFGSDPGSTKYFLLGVQPFLVYMYSTGAECAESQAGVSMLSSCAFQLIPCALSSNE